MQLTKRGEYALRTLIQLGIAQKMGRKVTPVSAIANKEKLPLKFLENIISELRHGGYLMSKRGKMGGVMLAKSGNEITIGEIVRLIDGRLAPIGCASETDYEKCSCPDEVHCGLRMLMIDVRNSIANILDRYTLADIVFVTIQKMERDGVCVPFSDELVISKSKPRVVKSVQSAAPADGFLNWLMAKI
jgi:Rrf2 family protein